MRVPQSYIQKCKVVAHTFQLIFLFIGGCLTIAVLTKDGETGGAVTYHFALCFLTIPALIYLVMVPMWSRAAKFANAYAFFSVDALYTVLWFAAFISIAMWNSKGIKNGAVEKGLDKSEGNCSTYKYGPEKKCELSRATIGMGAVVFLFFAITTGISAYYLHKFRKEGVMPYESQKINPHHAGGESHKDNAWSTEIEQADSDDEDRHTERGGNQEEDEYALLHSTETDEGRHPGRPLSWGDDRYRDPVRPAYAAYDDSSSAVSPGGYEEYRGAAAASVNPPGSDAPYGNGGQGYSFSGGNR